MMGERVCFSMSIDPADRHRAYITSHGVGSSFINFGDMYQLALRRASQMTGGNLEFIQRDGTAYSPSQNWDSIKEHSEVLGSDEARSIYAAYQRSQLDLYAEQDRANRLSGLLRLAEQRIAELHA